MNKKLNDEPTPEQIRELCEWCGWKFDIEDGHIIWAYTPDGDHLDFCEEPALDLNNLFKYAVPKLGDSLEIELFKPNVNWFCQIRSRTTIIATSKGYHKDPALALFWAIWEVIHNGRTYDKRR